MDYNVSRLLGGTESMAAKHKAEGEGDRSVPWKVLIGPGPFLVICLLASVK